MRSTQYDRLSQQQLDFLFTFITLHLLKTNKCESNNCIVSRPLTSYCVLVQTFPSQVKVEDLNGSAQSNDTAEVHKWQVTAWDEWKMETSVTTISSIDVIFDSMFST